MNQIPFDITQGPKTAISGRKLICSINFLTKSLNYSLKTRVFTLWSIDGFLYEVGGWLGCLWLCLDPRITIWCSDHSNDSNLNPECPQWPVLLLPKPVFYAVLELRCFTTFAASQFSTRISHCRPLGDIKGYFVHIPGYLKPFSHLP